MVVPFWTPITPLAGFLLHADPQFDRVTPFDLAITETHDFAGMAGLADQLVRRHGAAWDKMLALPPLSRLP